MKNYFLFIFFTFSILNAQNITFIYEVKNKSNPNIKDYFTENYYLDVLGLQSVFRSEKDRISDSLVEKSGYGLGRKINFNNQLYSYKNLANKSVRKNITSPSNDNYFINITEPLRWKIQTDTIKISQFNCQKANVSYGGRNWTAWFTSDISISDGPYIFYGLPGLIIKMQDESQDYIFNMIEVINSNKNNMFALRNGKEITWDTYRKLLINYYDNPFSEIKTMGVKYQSVDSNGQPINVDLKSLTESTQRQIKNYNNPLELNHKIDFK
ncbi:GLPGLI family protein [Planobacterium oryzisoli]|uniref:GLPGLI family protein n=1 Tax=Planobacterium oryzisoli TaxID=2771435 RepID=A0A930YWY1_9FLAO|nr:GLPGLI family protein [Planobacterium oryzisoli]MBF5027943.1 GLPGLI family protein [Planobacterium oryzisoli]